MEIEFRLSGLCIEPPRTITAPSPAVCFFFVCVCVGLIIYVGTRKGHQIPWIWSCGLLWATWSGCLEQNLGLASSKFSWQLSHLSSLLAWWFKKGPVICSIGMLCWGLVQGFVYIELELCSWALDQLLRSALWFPYFNVSLWYILCYFSLEMLWSFLLLHNVYCTLRKSTMKQKRSNFT